MKFAVKVAIKYKKGAVLISVCLFLMIPLLYLANTYKKPSAQIERDTIVAWVPSVKPEKSATHRPTAFSMPNRSTTLMISMESEILGGTGGTTKESPQHSYYSRGWNAENQSWLISGIATQGYVNLEISFWVRGSSTGPRDFELEFSSDGEQWLPLTSSSSVPIKYAISPDNKFQQIGPYQLNTVANDLDTLHIRFINTSARAISGDTVKSSGTSYITDIVITGEPIQNITSEGKD